MHDGSSPGYTARPGYARTARYTPGGLLVSLALPALVGLALAATVAPLVVAAGSLGLLGGLAATVAVVRRRRTAPARAAGPAETPH